MAGKTTEKKKPKSGKTLKVRQTGSGIGKVQAQRDTLKGLGLRRIGDTRELEDTAAVRGMVAAVAHLVEIVEERA
jgi:large subunit ribosomal protein L30